MVLLTVNLSGYDVLVFGIQVGTLTTEDYKTFNVHRLDLEDSYMGQMNIREARRYFEMLYAS